MEKLLFFAFLLYILQAVLTYFQIRNYRSTVSKLRTKGLVGIGTKKKKLGAGNIVILVSDESGKILEGQLMRGISVLARFKQLKDIDGIKIEELKEQIVNEDEKNTAMLDALQQIENQLLKVNISV
jgi:glucitol operon activator protein